MPGLQGDHLFALPVAIPVAVGFQFAALLNTAPLSPIVTGTLLLALTRAPEQYRRPVLSQLQKYLGTAVLDRGISILKGLVALGLVTRAHNFLSELAQNNFRFRTERHRYDWPNEIAVVTGAAGGIGSVMAADLAAKGVKVLALDIADGLPPTLQGNKKIFYYKCDLTSRSAVMEVAAQIQREHGHPSILINNAGIAYTHSILNCSDSAVEKLFHVNAVSHYWTIQAFLPAMIEQRKGHIACTASMASFWGTPTLSAYSASKAAALSLHETLGQELRRVYHVPEIQLTIVHPTFVKTAMTNLARTELESQSQIITPESVSAATMKNIFAGRGGQIVLPGTLSLIPTLLRGMPHWMSYSLIRAGEVKEPSNETFTERHMV